MNEVNETTLYWITRLDHIHGLLMWLTGLFFVGMGGTTILTFAALVGSAEDKSKGNKESEEFNNKAMKWLGSSATVFLLLWLSVTITGPFIPRTKEALIIYGVPYLIRTQEETLQEANKTPTKLFKLVNQYLDEHLQEEMDRALPEREEEDTHDR